MADKSSLDPEFWELRCRDRPRLPSETMAACVRRIDEGNASLDAVVVLDRSGAERGAEASVTRWARGRPLSPIDGVPILIKANFAVVGLPWHAGIAAYRNRVAAEDASVVRRLRDAGAVILGLTNMDEGALGANGDNAWLGSIGNPRRPGLSPGGSSGGSAAAVAAGFCAAALGSDTIGSIAIPAACCGVVGHRASRLALSIEGIMPLSPTFDHAGWHTLSTRGTIVIHTALGGGPVCTRPLRVAALTLDANVVPVIREAMALGVERLSEAGYIVERVEMPLTPRDIARFLFEVVEAEGAAVHRSVLHSEGTGLSRGFRRMLEWGASQGMQNLAGNLAKLDSAASVLRAALSGCDALLLPAMPNSGFVARMPLPPDQSMFAALPACLGWPASTVPIDGGASGALLVTASTDGVCLGIADRLFGLG